MKKPITAWRKGIVAGLSLALLSAAVFSACGTNGTIDEEPEFLGRVEEETGSAQDYTGWWQLSDYSGDVPFAFIEIPADDPGSVNCYDENGKQVDTGYIDYSEQRALNGNALMVFIFQSIGEYAANPYFSGDNVYWDIWDSGEFSGTLDPAEP